MIKLDFTQKDIDELNYLRFYHPDPIVMKRCETVYLKAKKLKTGQIHDLTGFDAKNKRRKASPICISWTRLTLFGVRGF